MATFVDLDSYYRDRDSYPNENAYVLLPAQVQEWTKQSRTVNSTAKNPGVRPTEFCDVLRIVSMQLPWSELLATFPRVYVNVESITYKDIRLIDTIDGIHSEAKFVCTFNKIQYAADGTTPLWIHYRCKMEQCVRYERGQPIIVSITSRSGGVLPQQDTPPSDIPDPTKQSLITFSITPYEIDGSFSGTRNSQPVDPK